MDTISRIGELHNRDSKLPIRAGLIAGIAGSLAVMVFIAVILIMTGRDIFTAARLVASVIFGPEVASVGVMPILIGTLFHLMTGAVFGLIFARMMPSLPRNIWILAGLMYGIATWAISYFLIMPVMALQAVPMDATISVLLTAHLIYGLILGMAGAGYGLWWALPGDK